MLGSPTLSGEMSSSSSSSSSAASSSSTSRPRLSELAAHLTCPLCGGYYIDATAAVECLHTFCRSCILRHLVTNSYCPVCDVIIHLTKGTSSLRSDSTLQSLVYKLVPGLFGSEMARRRQFYRDKPYADPELPSWAKGDEDSYVPRVYSPQELLQVRLDLYQADSAACHPSPATRFLRCPAAAPLTTLHKLLRAKFQTAATAQVQLLLKGHVLPDDVTLMDLRYMHPTQEETLHLQFRFLMRRKRPATAPEAEQIPVLLDVAVSEKTEDVSEVVAGSTAKRARLEPPCSEQLDELALNVRQERQTCQGNLDSEKDVPQGDANVAADSRTSIAHSHKPDLFPVLEKEISEKSVDEPESGDVRIKQKNTLSEGKPEEDLLNMVDPVSTQLQSESESQLLLKANTKLTEAPEKEQLSDDLKDVTSTLLESSKNCSLEDCSDNQEQEKLGSKRKVMNEEILQPVKEAVEEQLDLENEASNSAHPTTTDQLPETALIPAVDEVVTQAQNSKANETPTTVSCSAMPLASILETPRHVKSVPVIERMFDPDDEEPTPRQAVRDIIASLDAEEIEIGEDRPVEAQCDAGSGLSDPVTSLSDSCIDPAGMSIPCGLENIGTDTTNDDPPDSVLIRQATNMESKGITDNDRTLKSAQVIDKVLIKSKASTTAQQGDTHSDIKNCYTPTGTVNAQVSELDNRHAKLDVGGKNKTRQNHKHVSNATETTDTKSKNSLLIATSKTHSMQQKEKPGSCGEGFRSTDGIADVHICKDSEGSPKCGIDLAKGVEGAPPSTTKNVHGDAPLFDRNRLAESSVCGSSNSSMSKGNSVCSDSALRLTAVFSTENRQHDKTDAPRATVDSCPTKTLKSANTNPSEGSSLSVKKRVSTNQTRQCDHSMNVSEASPLLKASDGEVTIQRVPNVFVSTSKNIYAPHSPASAPQSVKSVPMVNSAVQTVSSPALSDKRNAAGSPTRPGDSSLSKQDTNTDILTSSHASQVVPSRRAENVCCGETASHLSPSKPFCSVSKAEVSSITKPSNRLSGPPKSSFEDSRLFSQISRPNVSKFVSSSPKGLDNMSLKSGIPQKRQKSHQQDDTYKHPQMSPFTWKTCHTPKAKHVQEKIPPIKRNLCKDTTSASILNAPLDLSTQVRRSAAADSTSMLANTSLSNRKASPTKPKKAKAQSTQTIHSIVHNLASRQHITLTPITTKPQQPPKRETKRSQRSRTPPTMPSLPTMPGMPSMPGQLGMPMPLPMPDYSLASAGLFCPPLHVNTSMASHMGYDMAMRNLLTLSHMAMAQGSMLGPTMFPMQQPAMGAGLHKSSPAYSTPDLSRRQGRQSATGASCKKVSPVAGSTAPSVSPATALGSATIQRMEELTRAAGERRDVVRGTVGAQGLPRR